MREDPTVDTDEMLGLRPSGGNIVALPNLADGRLADLLAAASGPAQPSELRGEQAARSAFVAAADAWPATATRRRFRRTPAVLAVTTVATMMVATTGLAAASELPGPAGRAVQGIFGAVGVNLETPAPAAPAATPTAALTLPGSHGPVWGHHAGSGKGACANVNAASTGSVETASCTITVPRHAGSTAPAVRHPEAQAPVVTGRGTESTATGRHRAGGPSVGSTTPVGTGTLPGGGSSRGGNQGTGGGTCGPDTPTTTDPAPSTTSPAGSTSATDPTTTDPTTTTTTTTDPTTTGGTGCGHKGGHRHGGTAGTATGTSGSSTS